MKANEVLKQYAAGERDFRKKNLQGQAFKGKDLSRSDFSEADIRGVNFTGANLQGAKFCNAKAGLEPRWSVRLLVSLLILSILSAFVSAIVGVAIAEFFALEYRTQFTTIPGGLVLTVVATFIVTAIPQGLMAVTGAGTVILAALTVVAAIVAATIAGALNVAVEVAFAIAVAAAGIVAVARTMAVSLVATRTVEKTKTGVGVIAGVLIVVAITVATVSGVAVSESVKLIPTATLLVAVIAVGLGTYVAYCSLNGDEQYSLVRTYAIAFATVGGTTFKNADLTDADFSLAILISTDFRQANLTRTRWSKARKLNHVRPGATYLQDAKIRQVLITGDGQNQDFNHKNLRGVNLQDANLTNASFIGTNLNKANLQRAVLLRAKLVQTQLDETNLIGATLTEATIEDWNITSRTKLQAIKCRYVFMRLTTIENPNPRRKPDNWEEEFEDGDFADFIQPIVETLDLYHNQGVDPRAIAISFKQLAENHPEAQLEIVAMEKRSQSKFLLRAGTTPQSNHSALNAEYFTAYNQIKALAEAEVQALLIEKDSRISSLESMVETALERPSFYTNTRVEQVGIMTNNPGGISQSNTGSMGGGQQAAIGDNNQQSMSTQGSASAEEQLSQQDVLQLLAELEQTINESEISADMKEEAQTYLSAAKKAIDKEEPNKERATINLEGVAEELEKASKVAEAGTTLFTKVKPILIKVAGWLGAVAAGSFFGTL